MKCGLVMAVGVKCLSIKGTNENYIKQTIFYKENAPREVFTAVTTIQLKESLKSSLG